MNPFVAYAKVPMSFLNLETHFVEAGPYALFLALVFELELAFVHFVQKRFAAIQALPSKSLPPARGSRCGMREFLSEYLQRQPWR
jgi:hypothetical protein